MFNFLVLIGFLIVAFGSYLIFWLGQQSSKSDKNEIISIIKDANNSVEMHYDKGLVLSFYYDRDFDAILTTNIEMRDLLSDLRPSHYYFDKEKYITYDNYWSDYHKTIGLDIIENYIFRKIAYLNRAHWDYKIEKHKTPTGNITTLKSNNSKASRYELENELKKFTHNSILKRGVFWISQPLFYLPENSIVSTKNQKNIRSIEISIPKIGVLKFMYYAFAAEPRDSRGIYTVDENYERILFQYKLNISFDFNKRTDREECYANWFNNISSEFSKLVH